MTGAHNTPLGSYGFGGSSRASISVTTDALAAAAAVAAAAAALRASLAVVKLATAESICGCVINCPAWSPSMNVLIASSAVSMVAILVLIVCTFVPSVSMCGPISVISCNISAAVAIRSLPFKRKLTNFTQIERKDTQYIPNILAQKFASQNLHTHLNQKLILRD